MEYKANSQLPATKQMIVAMPEVKTIKRDEVDFLIIACDGIWDCMTSQEAVDFVYEEKAKVKNPADFKLANVISNMFEKNIAEEIHTSNGIGCDNMTCIIVSFK